MKKIDVIASQAELPFDINLYDVVNLKISRHITKEKVCRYKIYDIEPNNNHEDSNEYKHLIKPFKEQVRINNAMGFGIESKLFFSPELVQCFSLVNNDLVCGRAIKNYNKKKKSWGWKAISISSVEKSEVLDE